MTCLDPDDIREWARPPGEFVLSWTEAVLTDALRYTDRLRDRPYEIFLQGSYANNTHISESSDVDLVVMLQLPFEENIEALDPVGLKNFAQRYEETFYGWEEFREDVLAALRDSHFVREGKKCVDIRDWDSLIRVPADILPAVEYRLYSEFPLPDVEIYEEGVFFRDRKGRVIVNFPKQHRQNGDAKNLRTGKRFKEVVRVAKHAVRRAVGRELLQPGAAPSFFIECLLYNVPDGEYRTALPEACCNAIRWLDRHRHENRDVFATMICQNGIIPIFGDGPDQWAVAKAESVLDGLLALGRDSGSEA